MQSSKTSNQSINDLIEAHYERIFFINERRRLHAYNNTGTQDFFWRTYDQQEIDLIEVSSTGSLEAFEYKWQANKHAVPGRGKKPIPKHPSNSSTQKTSWTTSSNHGAPSNRRPRNPAK